MDKFMFGQSNTCKQSTTSTSSGINAGVKLSFITGMISDAKGTMNWGSGAGVIEGRLQ